MRVRIKELAQEAKFIRHEENKCLEASSPFNKKGSEYKQLREHRVNNVRNAARAAQLAYAFLRGIPYKKIEPKRKLDKEYTIQFLIKKDVKRLVNKFGSSDGDCSEAVERWFNE